MGWFGDVCTRLVNVVGDAVSSTWKSAQEIASKAVAWMAQDAEKLVDGIKNIWRTVKPYVDQARSALKMAAAAAPVPWLKAALVLLDQGLGTLTAFENSPVAKKVEEALKWSIELAKRWHAEAQQESHLDESELDLAKQHQKAFRSAERKVLTEAQRHQLELASAINDFEIAKADLANAIDAAPANFEHYLRLRATQKLLNMADKQFRAAKSLGDLSGDDLFLVRIASDLIKPEPELNQEAAARLDRLLSTRYGKKLTPFIFEELIASWAKRAEALERQWDASNRSYARDSMLLKRLCLAKDIQAELSPEESDILIRLQNEVPIQKQALDHVAEQQRDMDRYVGAAEGFLQLLEKTPEQIEQEDRSYLIDDGAYVGQILIDCAEHDKPFSSLNQSDRTLLNDFANAFRTDSKNRMKEILEVTA